MPKKRTHHHLSRQRLYAFEITGQRSESARFARIAAAL
jgi:hypothetical protein